MTKVKSINTDIVTVMDEWYVTSALCEGFVFCHFLFSQLRLDLSLVNQTIHPPLLVDLLAVSPRIL